MSTDIDRFSIVTIVFFLLSALFVVRPVKVPLIVPHLGKWSQRNQDRPKWAVIKLPLTLNTVPLISVIILWCSQCIDSTVIRKGITGSSDDGVKPFNILLLFFSLAYLAISLDLTGALQAAAFFVCNKGGNSGRRMFLYFFLLLTALSVVLGNDPVILSGTVFLVYYTRVAEVSPISWLFAEFLACNTASMVLFVGNPTNVVICEGFNINYLSFTAYTILPFVGCIVAGLFALALQFHSVEYIPKTVNKPELQPKAVLLDPFGATVGSISIIACLAIIVGVSFKDVYVVSVPFAVCKIIFDIVRDFLRTRSSVEASRAKGRPDVEEDKVIPPFPSVANGEVNAVRRKPKTAEPGSVPQTGRQPPERPGALKRAKFFCARVKSKVPVSTEALSRLPYALAPFAICQFILVESLDYRGWISVFSNWLRIVTGTSMPIVVVVALVFSIVLCNIAGTNIGATILLVKILKNDAWLSQPGMSPALQRAAALALAVGSNIGAVSFTFSASLAGLLWKQILLQKQIKISRAQFLHWNILPLIAMTAAATGVILAESEVLYPNKF